LASHPKRRTENDGVAGARSSCLDLTQTEWKDQNMVNSHYEELHEILGYKDNQIKENEMSGHVTRMGAMRKAHKILIEKPEWATPTGRSRYY
jgi:hypothetical protein